MDESQNAVCDNWRLEIAVQRIMKTLVKRWPENVLEQFC